MKKSVEVSYFIGFAYNVAYIMCFNFTWCNGFSINLVVIVHGTFGEIVNMVMFFICAGCVKNSWKCTSFDSEQQQKIPFGLRVLRSVYSSNTYYITTYHLCAVHKETYFALLVELGMKVRGCLLNRWHTWRMWMLTGKKQKQKKP